MWLYNLYYVYLYVCVCVRRRSRQFKAKRCVVFIFATLHALTSSNIVVHITHAAYDQVQILAVHHWQDKVQGKGGYGKSCEHLINAQVLPPGGVVMMMMV